MPINYLINKSLQLKNEYKERRTKKSQAQFTITTIGR